MSAEQKAWQSIAKIVRAKLRKRLDELDSLSHEGVLNFINAIGAAMDLEQSAVSFDDARYEIADDE